MNLRRHISLWPLLALPACGGSQPPPPVTAEIAKPTAAPPAAAPELGPVPEPSGLVFFGRVTKPSDVLKVAESWTRLPLPGADAIGELLTGERTGKLVDLDQPVDLVASTNASKSSFSIVWAVAGAVTNVEDAKASLSVHYKLVPGDNGATIVSGIGGGGGDGDDEDDGKPHACELAPAAGAAPVRLVCASSESAMKALAPYLTRTTPNLTVPSDVHAELRLAPVRPFIVAGKAALPGIVQGLLGGVKDSSLLDLLDGATGEVGDLGVDLDKVTVDAKLSDALARADATVSFKTATSLTARLLTSHADRADVPPSGFWHLPVDAELAAYSRGTDSKDFEHPREMLLKALGHGLEKENIPEADRAAVTSAITHLVGSTGSIVYAKGQNFDDAAGILGGLGRKTPTPAESDRLVADTAGWFLIGYDESPARLQGAAKEFVSAFNRPALQKWAKADAKGKKIPILRVAPVSPALKLPKDTTHLVLTVFVDEDSAAQSPAAPPKKGVKAPPAPPKAQRAHDLHAFVVPDAGHVWLAFGVSDTLVASKVRAALADAPSAGTLAARESLEGIKDSHATSGGFSTLRGSVAGIVGGVDGVATARRKSVYALLQTVPEAGMAPILFTDTPTPASAEAAAGGITMSLRVPRAAIEGIVKYSVMGGKF